MAEFLIMLGHMAEINLVFPWIGQDIIFTIIEEGEE